MEIKKFKRSICIVLLFIVLLFEVCPANVQADSLFACQKESMSSLDAPYNMTLAPTVYLLEQQTNRLEASCLIQQSFKRIADKNTRSLFSFIAHINVLPQTTQALQELQEMDLVEDISRHMVLMNYIHHKDGKKPQLF